MEAEISELTRYEDASVARPIMSVEDIKGQVAAIQEVMRSVMHKDEHYGVIPGTQKPTLLKPGAEKLCLTFDLRPRFIIKSRDLGKGHREVEIICELVNRHGTFLGSGVGSCSTMESKYRYRWDNTGHEVPGVYWKTKDPSVLGGPSMVPRKKDGKWLIFQRVEHDNPADYYNTVLKIAKKRSQVDAVLTRTAASDMFTQDVEDMVENETVASVKPPATQESMPEQYPSVTPGDANTTPMPEGPHEEPYQPPTHSDSAVISEPRRKRLYAIARGAGLNDAQFKDEMVRLGYASSKDVLVRDYEDVCTHFENMKQQ